MMYQQTKLVVLMMYQQTKLVVLMMYQQTKLVAKGLLGFGRHGAP